MSCSLGARRGRAPRRWRYVLAEWLAGVLKVVVGYLAAEEGAGLYREAVVQACPDAGVVRFGPEVVCGCEVPRHREAWRALDVDVEVIGRRGSA